MKLQLINPPLNKDYSLSLRTGIYAPLNLATLAGYIHHYNSSFASNNYLKTNK